MNKKDSTVSQPLLKADRKSKDDDQLKDSKDVDRQISQSADRIKTFKQRRHTAGTEKLIQRPH